LADVRIDIVNDELELPPGAKPGSSGPKTPPAPKGPESFNLEDFQIFIGNVFIEPDAYGRQVFGDYKGSATVALAQFLQRHIPPLMRKMMLFMLAWLMFWTWWSSHMNVFGKVIVTCFYLYLCYLLLWKDMRCYIHILSASNGGSKFDLRPDLGAISELKHQQITTLKVAVCTPRLLSNYLYDPATYMEISAESLVQAMCHQSVNFDSSDDANFSRVSQTLRSLHSTNHDRYTVMNNQHAIQQTHVIAACIFRWKRAAIAIRSPFLLGLGKNPLPLW
jgi:hypothetical protein